MKIASDGVYVDAGMDGEFKLQKISYHPLDQLHTWELPPIQPYTCPPIECNYEGYEVVDETLITHHTIDGLRFSQSYRITCGALEVSAKIENLKPEKRRLNGVAYVTNIHDLSEDTYFQFPGNVPHERIGVSTLSAYETVETGFVNPLVLCETSGTGFNILFIDEEEKWGTGVYQDRQGSLNFVHHASVESNVSPGEIVQCGTLYIIPVDDDAHDPFEPVRTLYKDKGWTPPENGIQDGVLYSCHPHGTMDAGFPCKRTMGEFAGELAGLKDMGIDHVWLLPIFEHLDRGVYHPTDQSIIDSRYGGDRSVTQFVARAHELNMTVLFDYVPHGPAPSDPIALEHMDWASWDADGNPQQEWDCLSFDMANPGYQLYTMKLIRDHVNRFGIDGARIDCAMGGLSNWKPSPGNRPSSSGLKGGTAISKAIRDGFTSMNKKTLVTPENFHPVPFYAPYTDVFYDFPLYRTLYELEQAQLAPSVYVSRLTRWLELEKLSSAENSIKLRFLGNHDTVSWVWHQARATQVHGIEKAKALWVLMSTIDGIPMIYQGDEDAAIYGKEGPNLRTFFRGLFHARKQFLGNQFDIKYLYTDTPIITFERSYGPERRLITINLSYQHEQCSVASTPINVLYGQAEIKKSVISLEPYGYAIFDVTHLHQ